VDLGIDVLEWAYFGDVGFRVGLIFVQSGWLNYQSFVSGGIFSPISDCGVSFISYGSGLGLVVVC
jgi:hypothetical protein